MLGQLQQDESFVVCDLEAGVGTLVRLKENQVDIILVVVEPSTKSIEAGKRAVMIASKKARTIVVANRVTDEADVQMIRSAMEADEVVVIPEDHAISQADQTGLAPIDVAPDSPGVAAIAALGHRLTHL